MNTPTRTKRAASNTRQNSQPSKRRAVSSRRTNINAITNTASSNGRAPLQKLSRNEFDIVARHLDVRNIARLRRTGRNVGTMAKNVLRNREAKVALDVLHPKTQAMQEFARAVASRAGWMPTVPLFQFERVVNQIHEAYRGKFAIHIHRIAPYMDINMRAEVPDPNGGSGFLEVGVNMTIRSKKFKVVTKTELVVRVPSLRAQVRLRHNGFVFRDARPIRIGPDDDGVSYDRATWIDVDKEYKLGDMNPTTSLNYKYLVNRYAIWGERKWCRAALTPDQAFRSVDDVRAKKNDFIKLRAMLDVVAALFNDEVASELKHTIGMKMITEQGYACRLIARKKVHTLYGDYPLVEKMLLARTLTGRRASLSNHEILSLVNKRPYATLIENRIAKMQR